MKHTTAFLAIWLALAATHNLASATQISRTFVSPTGNDASDCSLGAPCRHLQAALAQTLPGGEIAILGTAGYNGGTTITITQAVSIVNPGAFEAGIYAPVSGNGIVINAGPNDAVSLRGLSIQGGGTGTNGIVFNSGGSLTIDNCFAQNLTDSGIRIQTSGTMTFSITKVTVSNNGLAGIYLWAPPSSTPNINGIIDRVTANGNYDGIRFETSNTSAGGTLNVSVSNSIASNNGNDGILFWAYGGSATVSASIDDTSASNNTNDGIELNNYIETLRVSIDGVHASGNQKYGVEAYSSASVLLGRSTLVNNAQYGVRNGTSPNTFYTYSDNHLDLNGVNDISGTLVSLAAH